MEEYDKEIKGKNQRWEKVMSRETGKNSNEEGSERMKE